MHMKLNADDIRNKFLSIKEQGSTPNLLLSNQEKDKQMRRAAVLLPIIQSADNKNADQAKPEPALSMLFTKRSYDLKYHPGQISFPGGSVDAADNTIADTALRETFEEVGISSKFIEVIGTLNNFITTSNFNVTPVVGLLNPGFTLLTQPEEVEEIFTVPFSFLMNENNYRWYPSSQRLPNGRQANESWLSIDYEEAGQHYQIWGATAVMTLEFYRFLQEGS